MVTCVKEKNKAKKGLDSGRVQGRVGWIEVVVLSGGLRTTLTEKVGFEYRPAGGEP